MAKLDTSSVNVSHPAIARAFGTTLSGPIEWVVIAYLMVVASLLLTVGWLSDRFGRRRFWAAPPAGAVRVRPIGLRASPAANRYQ